ncbi:MAG: hypothetical protein ACD_30C00087G0004 [uncultured bacterium]|uniref:Uncharacterized protein n=3 Tax=Candidatus Daviesiibacteriota TaxID=1752718 RepID=A0A0G0I2Y7_9BACT|nr:MAG: hypothetical protein ACD_30C00087G0004 [uncultured bacterium]KKQ10476.1 MAG: hypothetical protein US19_C0004G0024 [Candidatus Daviesbacteria bacterium GW2011_GWB1_36_5]KKQ16208.1 MAG: hypothetical protein US28_C0004G0050 [Candidatus Daviesbacteria bacterium GW2011_GWA1_36_8]OGE32618.1 MAG: hypothetical protein A3C99_02000 [Candidatus Daviesbacteria bacterium RIFCSPHIGHO2_02_FULL_37_9]OGE36183.1 MAG: hypothetical protein A3E66_05240 [Candidatus Daviesbacteria bacterium RIFCSPHIGHO2_12_FU
MEKILITHTNPHLDDIFAIWLFKKFNPDFKDAKVEFISASRDAASDQSEDKIYFGTGGGKFDEHTEKKVGQSAGSLVWNEVLEKNLVKDETEIAALEELVEWNNLIDTGKAPTSDFSEYSLQSILRPPATDQDSSLKSLKLGEEVLDRLFEVIKNKKMARKDWEGRVEFESKFGKAVAVKSEFITRAFCKQMGGADIFLMLDPKYNSVQYFTPNEIDLGPIYEALKKLDPDASWFLHQSHHMVICGSGSAPESKTTILSFDQLIDVLKEI